MYIYIYRERDIERESPHFLRSATCTQAHATKHHTRGCELVCLYATSVYTPIIYIYIHIDLLI